MEHDPHDANSRRHRRRPHGRFEQTDHDRQRRPRFCIEMLDAAFMDSDVPHRVVTVEADGDADSEEWIESDTPTKLYTNTRGEHCLTVTVRVEAGAVRMLATDAYAAGSLRRPPKPADRPGGSNQILWLAHPRSGLVIELVMGASGRIDAILGLEGMRPFNRADVPQFVRAFASAIDFAEQTIRETGLRQET